jgi:protein involved in polysaccharide export with SLBB domain
VPSRLTSRLNSAISGRRLVVFLLTLFALGSGLAFAQQTSTGISSGPPDAVVYILGAVKHPCMYVLEKRETITVYQALALAGGLSETARASAAKVVRRSDGSMMETTVGLRKVLLSGAQDIELGADDILVVPDSKKAPQRKKGPLRDPHTPGSTPA